jgi:PadR family transcriptional regulator, regulatory protein AphA
MAARELTTTSYALLGLLASRPWTTYELAKQMERSLRRFWPRAESNLYGAAKSLVQHGLANSEEQRVGGRRRVTYSITAKGRRALAQWVTEPGAGPVVEFEALVKIFFAEHGTRDDLLAQLAVVTAWADDVDRTGRQIARDYLDNAGPFSERLPMITLAYKYVMDQAATTRRWAQWAEQLVSTWPQSPEGWHADLDTFLAHTESQV